MSSRHMHLSSWAALRSDSEQPVQFRMSAKWHLLGILFVSATTSAMPTLLLQPSMQLLLTLSLLSWSHLATLPTPGPYCSAAAHCDVKCAGNWPTRASHHGSPDTNVPLLVYERSIQTKPPSFAGMCLLGHFYIAANKVPLPLVPISNCCRRRQKTTSLQHILIF
jgi:hypothetical protein